MNCLWCEDRGLTVEATGTFGGVGLCTPCQVGTQRPRPIVRVAPRPRRAVRGCRNPSGPRKLVAPSRFCEVCAKPLYATNASGGCSIHRKKPTRERRLCGCGCGEYLLNNGTKFLALHGPTRIVAMKPQRRYLSAKRACMTCRKPLRGDNRRDTCSNCRVIRVAYQERANG